MNLFGTVLTHIAPSANYRGESELNRAVMQKITLDRQKYCVYSSETLRNALRETLADMKMDCNRKRLHDEKQLAVEFHDYPDRDKYIDDFFFGWLIAATDSDKKDIKEEFKKKGRGFGSFKFRQDSILRMNLAVALKPFRHDSVFTQSPQDATDKEIKKHKNTDNSQLLHRDVSMTAFQYPFALNLNDCKEKPNWTAALLRAIGELNHVAGNQARHEFSFEPASIVLRLTSQRVPGYDSYCFKLEEENGNSHLLPEIISGIIKPSKTSKQGVELYDYAGDEFYIGGQIVKQMNEETFNTLTEKNVTLDSNSQRLLETVAKKVKGILTETSKKE